MSVEAMQVGRGQGVGGWVGVGGGGDLVSTLCRLAQLWPAGRTLGLAGSPRSAGLPRRLACPPPPRLQEVAQGRVWSGRRASGLGLVDAVGGLNRALQLAKQAAGLALDERVRLLEVSRAKVGRGAPLGGLGRDAGLRHP